MPNTLKLLLFLVLTLGVLIVLPQTQATTPTLTQVKINSKKDTVYTPKLDTISDTLILAGSVSTDQIATLRFKNSGKLNWVGAKVGDRIRRGQAIASLDREELRKNLQTQFNNYRTALANFNDTQDNYRTTRDKYLVTDTIQRILDRTQYSLDNAVINYEITDMAIKESVLVSPIDGILVSADQPIAGANVTPAGATFVVINPNNLYFKSEIDQEDVNKVSIGQKVTLKIDSFPDSNIESQITYIAFIPVSGQTSTVYEIRFLLPVDNRNLMYRLGMDGDAQIILNQASGAITIPTDAIVDDNGQPYVFVKSGKFKQRRDIKIGIENDNFTQVIQGLSDQDEVIVSQK